MPPFPSPHQACARLPAQTKDYTSFLAAVHSFLKHHRDTMVAVWHHGEIPGLIEELLGPMGWDHQWPKQ